MKQKNKMLKLCLYGAVLIFLTFYLHSGIPTGINYQGRYEENGQPVTGVRTFRFDLYNAPTGGTLLWTSGNVDINVVDGLFNYVLNCSNIDWRNNDVYLEITVGGTTLSPRERIQASAYAFYSSSASYAYKAGSGGDSVDVSVAGTTNRICKFVGSRTIGNSIITDDGTNVGIGTTSPSQKLEVYGGNISITRPSGDTSSAVLWLDQQNATQGGKYAIVARNTGEFAIYDGKTAKDRVYISTNGQVGIGTTVPDKPLTIQGIGTHHELVSFKDSTGTTKWHLNLRNSAGLNLAETGVADGRLFIAYGGNVGIGTTSPATALHVYRATVTATAFASDEYDVMIKPRNNSYAHVRNKDDTDYRGVACYNLYISSSGTYIDGSVVAGETAGYLTIKDGVNIRGNVNIAHTSNPGIELRDTDGGTPYIDFSNDTTSDYDGRIILNGDDTLALYGANLHIYKADSTTSRLVIYQGNEGTVDIGVLRSYDGSAYHSIQIENDGTVDPSYYETAGSLNVRGSLYVNGNFVVGGTKSFVKSHPTDPEKEICYVSLEGPEAGVYVRGTYELKNGEATIRLPEHFSLIVSSKNLTAYVTPRGETEGTLYIAKLTKDTLVVKESKGGRSNVMFDYIVFGVQQDHEDFEPIRDKIRAERFGEEKAKEYKEKLRKGEIDIDDLQPAELRYKKGYLSPFEKKQKQLEG